MSGSLQRQTGKPLAGSSASSGLLRKSLARLLQATITPNGLVIKRAIRLMTASLASSGLLTRVSLKGLAGTITSTSTLLRSLARALTGTVTPTGHAIQHMLRLLTGSLGLSGHVVLSKTILASLSGAVTPVSTLLRSMTRQFSGALIPAGILIMSLLRALSGTIGLSGAVDVVKMTLLSLGSTLTPTATLFTQVSIVFAATMTSASILRTQISRILVGSLTPTSALDAVKAFLRSFAGTLPHTGTLTKHAAFLMTASVGMSGTILRQMSRTLTAALSMSSALLRAATTSLSGSLTPTSALVAVKSFVWSVAGTVPSTGLLRRQGLKSLSALLTPQAMGRTSLSRLYAGTVGLAGVVATSRVFARMVEGTVASLGTLQRVTRKGLEASQALSGAIHQAVTTGISGTLSAASTLATGFGRVYSGMMTPTASLTWQAFIGGLFHPTAVLFTQIRLTVGRAVNPMLSLAGSMGAHVRMGTAAHASLAVATSTQEALGRGQSTDERIISS